MLRFLRSLDLVTSVKQPYHWLQGVLANIQFGFPSKQLKVIGVTGTDGKTTTSTLIYTILHAAGKKVALITTVSAYIGDEEIDTGFHVTTPDSFALQKLLRRIVDRGFEYVVLESTSHGIAQHRLWGITPVITVLTNITNEHLDYHRTYEAYLHVKASYLARSPVTVINKEDKSYDMVKKYIQQHHPDEHIFSYTVNAIPQDLRHKVQQRFPQAYNQQNAAAAIQVAQYLSITTKEIAEGIKQFRGVPGRMQEVPNDKGIRAIVDFAHTPNALENALRSIRATMKPTQRLIAVFGCAGLRDPSKRPAMGRIASELADEAVFTAEDPRTEDIYVILRQMKEGVIKNHGHMHAIADRREAIVFALQTLAKKGDVVGFFGKGHEKSLNMDGVHELPWSDVEEVKKALM